MSGEENTKTLVIKTGLESLFAPVQKLLIDLLGPSVTAVGLSLGDSANLWRDKRRLRLLQEVKRLLDECDEDIKPVATRLFFPILGAASIEDDDEMQTRWAGLIANEAISTGSVHPSFIEILRQMAPGDAQLLDRIVDWCEAHPNYYIGWEQIYPSSNKVQRERDEEAAANLVRLALIVRTNRIVEDRRYKWTGTESKLVAIPRMGGGDVLSDVATRFVKACRAPRKK